MTFEGNTLYPATDDRLRCIAAHVTFARWRMNGTGPRYIRLSARRVAYLGRDLNEWLESRAVEPRDNAAA